MGKHRTYTDAEMSAALTAYVEIGPSKAAELVGIGKGTISGWAKRHELRTVRNQKTAAATAAAQADAAKDRAELDRLLIKLPRRLAEMVLKAIENGTIKLETAQDVKDLAIAMATILDKYRLEMGEHTGREQRDVNISGASMEELEAELAALDRAELELIEGGKSG